MFKAIIFDIGGVVVGPFGEALLTNASSKLRIPLRELRRLMNSYEPDLQRGRIDHITFWKKILRKRGQTAPERIIKPLWMTPYHKRAAINREVLHIITGLRRRYIVGCISNCQEPHNAYNVKRRLFSHFAPCLLSSEIGIRKPDPRIFRLFLKNAGCKASETIFIDDEKQFLPPARKLGIVAVHYQNPAQLRGALRTRGIDLA
jgi:FMN phosphatase YigB (HAD superfamily)